MKRKLALLLCRLIGHGEPVSRDYDLPLGKAVIVRCGRCNTMLDLRDAPRVQYPRRRTA